MIHINTEKLKEKIEKTYKPLFLDVPLLPVGQLCKLHYLAKETQFLGGSCSND